MTAGRFFDAVHVLSVQTCRMAVCFTVSCQTVFFLTALVPLALSKKGICTANSFSVIVVSIRLLYSSYWCCRLRSPVPFLETQFRGCRLLDTRMPYPLMPIRTTNGDFRVLSCVLSRFPQAFVCLPYEPVLIPSFAFRFHT